VLAQAYEPFFSTKPEGKGSGLGLSMVYGFVKQSGGHVKIHSEPGHGTTVKLYLPRTHDKEDLGAVMESTPVLGGAETILVAEDDEQVRVTVVETLSELGYRVLKASDAGSALAIIESGVPIDLLFTDVVMPGPLRSPELARRARQLIPGIAVLFTSGYTESAIVHGGRLDAGVELLGKPYTREALARKIRHVLANRTQRAAPRVVPVPPGVPSTVALSVPAGRFLNILFVEDDDLIRSNTSELLMALGHVVHEAANAQMALGLIQKEAVDLLITDVGLPGMSGEELAIKARVLRRDLAVIFATGSHHVSKVPGFFLLRKPYDAVSMAALLRQVQ
jgi:CheY-like chemotaxis protein